MCEVLQMPEFTQWIYSEVLRNKDTNLCFTFPGNTPPVYIDTQNKVKGPA